MNATTRDTLDRLLARSPAQWAFHRRAGERLVVLAYHAISLWIPALFGSVAFAQLRAVLQRETDPLAMCMPLAEPIQVLRQPAVAA